ncbi:kinase-like domain-containing protein [Cubamyces lactineus]|nr:kinase-like domain-containing protein [Cubamyces lactineus]
MPLSSAQVVTIALYGEPDVGRKTFMSAVDGRTYFRRSDGNIFTFKCLLGAAQTEASIALLLIDASNLGTIQAARSNIRLAKNASSLCSILFTKIDLVPMDSLDMRYRYLWFERDLSFHYDADTLSANLLDPHSVDRMIAKLARVSLDLSAIGIRLLDAVLNWVASCFALPLPPSTIPDAPELDALVTDRDVSVLVNEAVGWDEELKKRLHAEDAEGVGVHRITSSLLAKIPASSSERASMEYVRQHTSIPIPRTYHPQLSWLLMDFIDGDMLLECWPKQSRFMQFRIACTLRLYVQQLHSLKRDTVGTVDSNHVCGIFFQEEVLPSLHSMRQFKRFCDMVALEGWKIVARRNQSAGVALPPVPTLPSNWTPTFIHGDLNASNVLLDKQGVLWLLDWGTAGFYPPCLEALSMQFVEGELNADLIPPSWTRYRRFIAGNITTEDRDYWMHVYTAIHRFHAYSRS